MLLSCGQMLYIVNLGGALSVVLGLFVRTRSSMLPQVWVDDFTSCVKLDSKTNSQKLLETGESPLRVGQSMSGKLKSPRIMDKAVIIVK